MGASQLLCQWEQPETGEVPDSRGLTKRPGQISVLNLKTSSGSKQRQSISCGLLSFGPADKTAGRAAVVEGLRTFALLERNKHQFMQSPGSPAWLLGQRQAQLKVGQRERECAGLKFPRLGRLSWELLHRRVTVCLHITGRHCQQTHNRRGCYLSLRPLRNPCFRPHTQTHLLM